MNNMTFNFITIFPDLIFHYCAESILGRAQAEKLITVNAIDLRDFTTDKHRSVDDTPYGGGAGMVMKPEPIYRALLALKALPHQHTNTSARKQKTILLSPRGRQFDQRLAEEWARLDELTLVCGRYEGVDQRVSDYMVDEEISIGPYVLAGGELAALVIIEAVSRLLTGVLGNPESLNEETFTTLSPDHPTTLPLGKRKKVSKKTSGQVVKWLGGQVIEYPHYTKPADFMGWTVPEVLLSGDHQKIAAWRRFIPKPSPPPPS